MDEHQGQSSTYYVAPKECHEQGSTRTIEGLMPRLVSENSMRSAYAMRTIEAELAARFRLSG
jgi:hypothetical protein